MPRANDTGNDVERREEQLLEPLRLDPGGGCCRFKHMSTVQSQSSGCLPAAFSSPLRASKIRTCIGRSRAPDRKLSAMASCTSCISAFSSPTAYVCDSTLPSPKFGLGCVSKSTIQTPLGRRRRTRIRRIASELHYVATRRNRGLNTQCLAGADFPYFLLGPILFISGFRALKGTSEP